MKEASDNYQVWIGIGIDPKSKCITVLAFAMDKEECRTRSAARSAEAGCASFDVFSVLSKNLRSSLLLWLAENEIYGAEAAEIVRDIGRSLAEEMKDLKGKFIGEKNDPQPGTPEGFPPPVRRSGKLAAAAHAALQAKPLDDKT
jgi:hypothetical protein